MKKRVPKKVIAAAVAFAATLNMNGCGVYGPAPDEEETFEPSANFEMDVYGPPPDFDVTEESGEATEESRQPDYLPEENIEACVYGPPEWFE